MTGLRSAEVSPLKMCSKRARVERSTGGLCQDVFAASKGAMLVDEAPQPELQRLKVSLADPVRDCEISPRRLKELSGA